MWLLVETLLTTLAFLGGYGDWQNLFTIRTIISSCVWFIASSVVTINFALTFGAYRLQKRRIEESRLEYDAPGHARKT
jgi:hypothetical protein